MADDQEQLKRQVAAAAAARVADGMRLGLGSGSTVNLVVAALDQRVRDGALSNLHIVAASSRTEAAIVKIGLRPDTLEKYPELDLAIDGADEIDPQFVMIKGGGGALLRERIVLAAAAARLIVVDESKLVPMLGVAWSVPVEVVPFGWRVSERGLRALGARPVLRTRAGVPAITDEGNYILDCAFGMISDPARLAALIAGGPGIVAHGIFVDLADELLIAGRAGVEIRRRTASS